ncbi:hypothetical protein, unlikely [Trypanosoma brucei brucei TREU927]|uniref:Uncharacterized protein n=1 Tax=Trypanosoma brucei brucei (strain 927/4 GUTat10.1) TaxID=185431 RepID=Q4GY67_TRYB2|nr:hypothetical protein, unlikely [Trypanosoma brucei brucei TREU927]CAJ16720.1 hypothetical protein, unlikely [Trypanosoma brucei brucei TREU927]
MNLRYSFAISSEPAAALPDGAQQQSFSISLCATPLLAYHTHRPHNITSNFTEKEITRQILLNISPICCFVFYLVLTLCRIIFFLHLCLTKPFCHANVQSCSALTLLVDLRHVAMSPLYAPQPPI